MIKLFGYVHIRKLFRTTAVRNLAVYRGIPELRFKGWKIDNLLNVNFRCLSCSASLTEQHSADLKDAVKSSVLGQKSKPEELDAGIAPYVELATDATRKKKILVLLMDHHLAKLEGKLVPSQLSVDDMRELLSLYSASSRAKFMSFLFTREKARLNDKRRKEVKKINYEKYLKEKETVKPSEHITYGIGNNTLMLRVRRRSMMSFYNQRLCNAALHGEKLIVDLDYDVFMRREDINNCSEQLLELYGANRRNRNPYDLIFCNASLQDPTFQTLRKYMPTVYAPNNFITATHMSYLDIFPKEKLVYITPYAKEPLNTYDHNAIYIIGGLVDKAIREPVVLAKVKREGLKAVHLPYEDYIMWGKGSKSLPLNLITEILLEMKNTGDWNKAFHFVPRNKRVRNLDMFNEF